MKNQSRLTPLIVKYHQIFALLPIFIVGCAASQTTAMPEVKQQVAVKDCKALSTELSQHENLTDSPIREPGVYCLPADVTAYRSDGGDYVGLLSVAVSNVFIDLQNHMLNVKSRDQPAFLQSGRDAEKLVITNITIRNGTVKSSSYYGMHFSGVGLLHGRYYGSDRRDFNCNDFNPKLDTKEPNANTCIFLNRLNQDLAKVRNNFPLTKHIINNVKVSAEEIGVGIKGGGNSIRNSIIKIGENDIKWGFKTSGQVYREAKPWGGGTASIYLFGPNQLIENNIIIFKGKTRTSRSSAAPIKIHAADDTIIRNNTIIIESSGEDVPQTAISIFDSKNVVIENNQIFGTKSVYKIWDEKEMGISVKETGTTFPPIWKKPNPKF